MAVQEKIGMGLLDSGLSTEWLKKSRLPSTDLLLETKPALKLELRPSMDFGMTVKPLKFPLGGEDSSSVGSLLNSTGTPAASSNSA